MCYFVDLKIIDIFSLSPHLKKKDSNTEKKCEIPSLQLDLGLAKMNTTSQGTHKFFHT